MHNNYIVEEQVHSPFYKDHIFFATLALSNMDHACPQPSNFLVCTINYFYTNMLWDTCPTEKGDPKSKIMNWKDRDNFGPLTLRGRGY